MLALARIVAALAVLAGAVPAHAEDAFGIPLPAGCKRAPELEKWLGDAFKRPIVACRSGKGVKELATFFRRQPGVRPAGEPTDQAAWLMKDAYDVMVQRPWASQRAMEQDTLVTVMKAR